MDAPFLPGNSALNRDEESAITPRPVTSWRLLGVTRVDHVCSENIPPLISAWHGKKKEKNAI
jgi:hypothetical protein